MNLLSINDRQCVPINKIDYVGISNDDRRNLVIHTVGNMNIINHYPSEYDCMKEYNNIHRILNENS